MTGMASTESTPAPHKPAAVRVRKWPYTTDTGEPTSREGVPAHKDRRAGLERIARLPDAISAADVVKAVSGHALGYLDMPKERLASLRLLGEAYGLWGARAKGIRDAQPPAKGAGFEVEVS